MKFTTRQIALLGVCSLFAPGLTGCIFKQPDPVTNIRPACVTLDNYSYVIEQVMNVQPDWELLEQSMDGYQYQWTIDDESGKHTLSTTLTSDECVCATVSSSRFSMGSGQEEIVGLLQGAAVAPVSNLDYTAKWLEPKIFFSCGIAYLSQQPYEAETSMEDRTTWRLTCFRNPGSDAYDSLYTLTVITPGCADILE